MLPRASIPGEKALLKIKRYCAYQERSHKEVMHKLYSWGFYKKEAELLLSQLIEEGYLNEERFAILFAGGKFRIKQWGKKRIEQALKERQVSSYCIKKALLQIDSEAYRQTLQKLACGKWEQLKAEKDIFIKKRKLQDYLLQKGYEYELVREVSEHVAK
jgi:regulatory protein